MDQDIDKKLKTSAVVIVAVLILSNAFARGDESIVAKGAASITSFFQSEPENYLVTKAKGRKGAPTQEANPSPAVEDSGLEIHELYSGIEVRERRAANIFIETWRILVGDTTN
jgi:hypothetical protein